MSDIRVALARELYHRPPTRRRARRERIERNRERRAVLHKTTHLEHRCHAVNHYGPDGHPCSFRAWVRRTELRDGTRVALTRVGRHFVSTTWLGIDMSYGDGSPPLAFETMVFGDDGDALDGTQWRHTTRDEALLWHAVAVELCRKVAHDAALGVLP